MEGWEVAQRKGEGKGREKQKLERSDILQATLHFKKLTTPLSYWTVLGHRLPQIFASTERVIHDKIWGSALTWRVKQGWMLLGSCRKFRLAREWTHSTQIQQICTASLRVLRCILSLGGRIQSQGKHRNVIQSHQRYAVLSVSSCTHYPALLVAWNCHQVLLLAIKMLPYSL